MREIVGESGELEINPGFWKSTRKTKDETCGDQMLVGRPPHCDTTLISCAKPRTSLSAARLPSIPTFSAAVRRTARSGPPIARRRAGQETVSYTHLRAHET